MSHIPIVEWRIERMAFVEHRRHVLYLLQVGRIDPVGKLHILTVAKSTLHVLPLDIAKLVDEEERLFAIPMRCLKPRYPLGGCSYLIVPWRGGGKGEIVVNACLLRDECPVVFALDAHVKGADDAGFYYLSCRFCPPHGDKRTPPSCHRASARPPE